jgi:hypothetical protein
MKYIMTNVCSDVRGFVSDNNEKLIVKTPYNISGKMIVVIHESLVVKLGIDENITRFQEILTEDGILLKIIGEAKSRNARII